jgi:TRAP-type uncharacterized transport system substrate-binding protein
MTSLAINLWPRWLRISIVGAATAAAIGGGWFAYRYFAKPIVLTVAAGSVDGEALGADLGNIGAPDGVEITCPIESGQLRKFCKGRRIAGGRKSPILQLFAGDTAGLADARSVLLLTYAVVMIVAPSSIGADSLGDLRDTTIGVVGGTINAPTVNALKQVYQFDRAKVRFEDVAIADGGAALSSGRVHALLAVAPLTEKYLSRIRQFFQQAGAKGSMPKLIAIESAGAVANLAQYYESYDIPKGTLRGAPPVPSDDLTSLRVAFFLVANKSVDADAITDLTQSLVDARRDLLSQFPILAQAAAPSADADALIPIHPGAATYYNGNQQSFLDKYDDKLYYGSLLLGSLISIILAAWRFAGSGTGPQSMLEPLYELGNEIRSAKSEAELDEIERWIDDILKTELSRNAGGEGADSSEMAALGLAAHRLQYLMSHCRARLAHAPASHSSH